MNKHRNGTYGTLKRLREAKLADEIDHCQADHGRLVVVEALIIPEDYTPFVPLLHALSSSDKINLIYRKQIHFSS